MKCTAAVSLGWLHAADRLGAFHAPYTYVAVVLLLALLPATNAFAGDFVIEPAAIELQGNFDQTQVLVRGAVADAQSLAHAADKTLEAQYQSSDEKIFTVSATGNLVAVADGAAKLRVIVDGKTSEVAVAVSGVVAKPLIEFDRHVRPVLSKAGCNMGACHASQHGKGGFKLSVFGFDPRLDHDAILRDRLGRRVNLLSPEQSLFLQKPTMQVAHGGGLRLRRDTTDYRLLQAWLANQAPAPKSDAPTVTKLSVTPPQRIGPAGLTQQLRVEAEYSDGTTRDVTSWAKYDSMDDGVLGVSGSGLVTGIGKGQAPVMVRFETHAQLAMFVIPYKETVELAGWTNNNFIDELAEQKFRELGIEPSPLCDDATFVRRVFVDVIGTLPTREQTEAFLQSTDPDKRKQLIDRLLGLTGDPALDIHNEAYSAYWTLKWSDLIRNTSNKLGEQGMWQALRRFRTRVGDRQRVDLFQRAGELFSH
jgi:hypothetical protein